MKQKINYESLKEAVIAFAENEPQVWPHWWQKGWKAKPLGSSPTIGIHKGHSFIYSLNLDYESMVINSALLMGIDIDAYTERVFEFYTDAVVAYWETLKLGDHIFEGSAFFKAHEDKYSFGSLGYCYMINENLGKNEALRLYELFRLDLNPAYKVES